LTVAGISLSGIRYIYEARLRAKAVLVQEVFAILGIAVGVALLFASQVSSTSLTHSVAQLNSQLVGSAQLQLDARGAGGFKEGLLAEVRHLPGVQVALPVLERHVDVIGPAGERSVDLIGVDAQSLPASGPLLRRFSAKQIAAQQVVALPAPLAREIGVGPLVPVKLQIGSRFVEALVGTTLGEADIGDLIHSPVMLTPIGYGQRLVGARGQISRIFVRFDPARAKEVRAALARLAGAWNVNLVPGQFDSRLFAVAVAPESESEAMFSAISALVGFMFALNAMLVTVPSRRKLIEDVRPHGATRWDTVKILLFDAAAIGMLACVLGLILGDLLSIAVFHTTPGYLAFAFPVGNNRIVTWQTVVFAVIAGMSAAVIGVLWPVRQILARPIQPPPGSADHRQTWITARLITGLMCLLFTTLTLLSDSRAAVAANIALVIALVCLLPFLFDGLVALFRHVSDLLDGVASALAVTELQTQQTRVRSLAIAATAAVAVFGAVEFQGTQTNLTDGLDASAHDIDATASIWVSPGGESNAFATTAFKNINLRVLTRLPGVRTVGIYRGSFLDWGERRLWILAPPGSAEHPVPSSQLVSGDPVLVAERIRKGNWAVLSQTLAIEHHLSVGEAFTLPSPRPITLRVAGLITNLGWAPGAMVLSSNTYARAWASNSPSAYEIRTTAGTPAVVVRNRVRRALASEPGLAVETAAEREQRHYALAAQGLSRLTQIRLLVLIAAILAVVGAMGAMIWQRRDLIAFIKCHGYQESVLWRWLLCEAAVLLMAGCSIGTVFGLYAQLLGSRFLSTVTGFPVIFDLEGVAAISSFALVTVIALAVVALPGYLVVRVPPKTTSPAY
jgi:putative ABC transport system permease protein